MALIKVITSSDEGYTSALTAQNTVSTKPQAFSNAKPHHRPL